MSHQTIIITVPADHRNSATTVAVVGVAGPGCKDLTKAIETALGAAQDVHNTVEFDQQVTSIDQQQQIGQG